MKIKSTSVYFGVVHVNKVFVIIHLVTLNKKLSYHRDSTQCGCRNQQPKSII